MRWIGPLRGESILEILLKDGWKLEGKRGRHVLLAKEGQLETITFPLHPTIPLSKARVESIWKVADMTPERFQKLTVEEPASEGEKLH